MTIGAEKVAEFRRGSYRRIVAVSCLAACIVGSVFSAGAQNGAKKDGAGHRPFMPRHGASSKPGVSRFSANAQSAATTSGKQIVIHNFASPSRGAFPSIGVIRDLEGNLYGTTNGSYSDVGGGGTNNAGVVFRLDRFGDQSVLYSFTGGADGGTPNGLVLDFAGNLYGTTSTGGASGAGVVFKL